MILPEARTEHERFEKWKASNPHMTWREHRHSEWKQHIEFYDGLGLKLFPIGVRQKSPIRNQPNYPSRGVFGPYISSDEALKTWCANDFNIACAAGASGIILMDMDTPELFKEEWLKGLCFRSPRGFELLLKPDSFVTESRIEKLKALGYDPRLEDHYSLLPVSQTCTFDHNLGGFEHPGPRHLCLQNRTHDFRAREFLTSEGKFLKVGEAPPNKPMLSFKEFLEAV